MKRKFRMLYDKDIVDSVRGMMIQTSNLKTNIFKNLMSGSSFDKSAATTYLSYVNGYLQWWENFANNMNQEIQATDNPGNAYSVGYDYIKDFIYDEYDYDSITKFADGVISGVKEQTMTKKSDIDAFFSMTVRKAFGNRSLPDSAAGLLDTICGSVNTRRQNPNDYDRRMFNALRHNTNLFDSHDRVAIYNNVKEVVKFIADNSVISNLFTGNNVQMYVSTINSITDFAVYALTIYAVRIYAINLFAYPYINAPALNTVTPVAESGLVHLPNNTSEIDEVDEVAIMRDANESDCKDPSKLIATLLNACLAIGANGFINDFNDRKSLGRMYVYVDDLKNNSFVQKMISNDLYGFIQDCAHHTYTRNQVEMEKVAREINSVIKSLISPRIQAAADSSSPKNEFMAIVRGVTCGNTAKEYQQLFAELTLFASFVEDRLTESIHYFSDQAESALNSHKYPIGNGTLINENIKLLQDMNSDLLYLFLQKGREIESKYNGVSGSLDVNAKIGLNLPKSIIRSKETTSEITNAVPDSSRVPVDLSDLYALPAFEYFQFYDEAVKVGFDLKDDLYYAEAFNVSEIVNKIKAWLQAIGKRLVTWRDDVNRKKAFEWATKHGDDIVKMDFSDCSMEVLPFKNSGGKENIDLGGILNKLVTGLNNFRIDIVNSPDEVEKYLKTLYPDDVVYEWFRNESKNGEAAAKFHSYVLFKDINSVSTKPEAVVTISGQEIAKRCAWWVETCKNGQNTFNELIKMNDRIIQAQSKIQQATASITSSAGHATSTDSTLSSASNTSAANQNTGGSNGNTSTPTTVNQQQQDTAKVANVSTLLNGVQNVINRIYQPIMIICKEYQDAEYNYLKTAYSLGVNASSKKNSLESQ